MQEQGTLRPFIEGLSDFFKGHIPACTSIWAYHEPNEVPWLPCATITIGYPPQVPCEQQGQCVVIDVLHGTEQDKPCCSDPLCRCQMKRRKEEQEEQEEQENEYTAVENREIVLSPNENPL